MAKRKKTDSTRGDARAAGSKEAIAVLRGQLDAIDREILAAINRRAEVAREIGRAKQSEKRCIFDPKREAEVLDRLAADNEGPLTGDSIRTIFREVISGCPGDPDTDPRRLPRPRVHVQPPRRNRALRPKRPAGAGRYDRGRI